MTKKPIRLTRDGLPVDARDYTVEDWKSLNDAIEQAKKEIRERHEKDRETEKDE